MRCQKKGGGMKKNILLISTLIITFFVGCSHDISTKTKYLYSYVQSDEHGTIIEKKQYDKNGNLVYYKSANEDYEILLQEYDRNNRLIHSKACISGIPYEFTRVYNSDGYIDNQFYPFKSKSKYIYSSIGECDIEHFLDASVPSLLEKDICIEQIFYPSDGSEPNVYISYKIDEDGNYVTSDTYGREKTTYSKDGLLININILSDQESCLYEEWLKCKYDEKNRPILLETPYYSMTFEYDSFNRWTKHVENSNGTVYEYKRDFDFNGNILYDKSFLDCIYRYTYQYDQNNNCTSKLVEEIDGGSHWPITETWYEYDLNNNCIYEKETNYNEYYNIEIWKEYNKDNQLICKKTWNGKTDKQIKLLYEYDEMKDLVLIKQVPYENEEDHFIFLYTYQYKWY